ncbi:MAG: NAD(P)H-dependent oxidoreductase subunit E [Saprospiraceae bacterium]|nr:NAD(P)H-dependent oxidoreductase subunit E [Saprospiraceae bacterium]
MSKNLSHLSGRKGIEDNLFDRYGRLNGESTKLEDLEKLADEFLIGTANIHGSTTFYDFLKPENKDKEIYVCNGSACLCAGTQEHVRKKLSERFSANQIGDMCCLGRCHENSAFHYKGKNYSGNAIDQLNDIINEKSKKEDDYLVTSIGKSILTSPFTDIENYYKPLEDILNQKPQDLIAEIKKSGLRGRGGAGFPMGLKLEFCSRAESDTKFIICNADEGDPGAYSDRYLLEKQPHAVLFGMLVSGYVTGAKYGILYIRGEYPESVQIIEAAIKNLYDKKLAGNEIIDSNFSFHFKVIKAQGAYICGEETALINSIEGQRPEVRTRPPYPAQYGLFGKPTTVSNVETLAALPFICREGGEAYAKIGTHNSTGTKLLSLDSFFQKPGIYEVEMGISLGKVIDSAGGFRSPVKALHIGGPLGGLIPVEKIPDLTVDFESFKKNGFLLGHASVVCIPEKMPVINYLKHLFEFAAHESCGKCFPCRLGTKRAEEMLSKSIEENYQIDRDLFDDLIHTLEEGSLCAHGGGIPLPVKNALKYFARELSPNFTSPVKA